MPPLEFLHQLGVSAPQLLLFALQLFQLPSEFAIGWAERRPVAEARAVWTVRWPVAISLPIPSPRRPMAWPVCVVRAVVFLLAVCVAVVIASVVFRVFPVPLLAMRRRFVVRTVFRRMSILERPNAHRGDGDDAEGGCGQPWPASWGPRLTDNLFLG